MVMVRMMQNNFGGDFIGQRWELPDLALTGDCRREEGAVLLFMVALFVYGSRRAQVYRRVGRCFFAYWKKALHLNDSKLLGLLVNKKVCLMDSFICNRYGTLQLMFNASWWILMSQLMLKVLWLTATRPIFEVALGYLCDRTEKR